MPTGDALGGVGGSGPTAPLTPIKTAALLLASLGALLLLTQIPAIKRPTTHLITHIRPTRHPRGAHH